MLDEEARLTSEQETALYRAAQEALTNIAKHAGGQRQVRLRRDGDCVELTVADNGRGFSKTDTQNEASFGLVGMRERLALVHGSLELDTAPGVGTTVYVRVPVASTDVA